LTPKEQGIRLYIVLVFVRSNHVDKESEKDYTRLCEEVFGFKLPTGASITSTMIEELYKRYRGKNRASYPVIWDKLIKDVFVHTSDMPHKPNAITAAVTRIGSSGFRILYIGDLVSQDPARVKNLMGQKSWEALTWCMEREGIHFGTDVGTWQSDKLRAALR
jgi:hypothetical protein